MSAADRPSDAHPIYLAGSWVDSPHRLEVGNPAHPDRPVGATDLATEEQYEEAAEAAVRGFEALDVGGVVINDVPAYRVDHMPYGGVKESGIGREGLCWAIEDMTELRLVMLAQPG